MKTHIPTISAQDYRNIKSSGDSFLFEIDFFSNELIRRQPRVDHPELEYRLYHKWPRPCAGSPPLNPLPNFARGGQFMISLLQMQKK